jgi:NAD dependent epimerase/dehydratase
MKTNVKNNHKVLITGAGGFIGSHLVEQMVLRGANVRAFVRYNSRGDIGLLKLLSAKILKEIDIVMGDLRDTEAIRQSVKGINIIFHLGSLISIPYSYIHPREVIDTNNMGTLNILMAARDNNVEKIIHTSSSEVYGTPKYVPIDENHPLQGQSPYSASKIGADMIAFSFYCSYGLPIAIIRPFNAFGPRQSDRAVIPTIISQALVKEKICLGSLDTKRDYTYINDTVEGFIKIAESSKSVGEVINIGANFEISIGDIAKKVMKILGKDKEIILDQSRIRPKVSEVERLWCDNTKAKQILGWKTTVNFEQGLENTIQWISSNLNLYDPDAYNV